MKIENFNKKIPKEIKLRKVYRIIYSLKCIRGMNNLD